jgi:hypothetical protein
MGTSWDIYTLDIGPLERDHGLVDLGGIFDWACIAQLSIEQLSIEVPWHISHEDVPTEWVTGQ